MTTEFIPANSFSLALFLFVVAATLVMLLLGAHKVSLQLFKKLALFTVVWILILSVVVLTGALKRYPFPGLPLFFATIVISAFTIGLGPWGRQLSQLPVRALIVFQLFRLPLEVVLHLWAQEGTVPETMTWSGQNFDVITGLLAVGGFFQWANSKSFAWFFNFVGAALLLNVMRVAIMSSPLSFAWHLERPLQLALFLPYALIGVVCVWAAIIGHIVLTRALLKTYR